MLRDNALYIVATPIGNLLDMTLRAIETLKRVDLIAAEDTRHSAKLMQHFDIKAPMIPYHDHGDEQQTQRILEHLKTGKNVALISDAGTPLISDPGYRLVFEARKSGFRVIPLPGACAFVTAISAAGLPSDRFSFEGFPPAKAGARDAFFEALAQQSHTLIFYESPHRIFASLNAMENAFGSERQAVLARELSKNYETFLSGSLGELVGMLEQDENQRRGEFVMIIAGKEKAPSEEIDEQAIKVLNVLLEELKVKQACSLAAKITGEKKNKLYQWALDNK